MTTTLRVHFDGRVLVPEQPVDLPIGQSVEIRIQDFAPPTIANKTVAALLAIMSEEPRVTAEDTAELDRVMAEGKQLIYPGGVFDGTGGQ